MPPFCVSGALWREFAAGPAVHVGLVTRVEESTEHGMTGVQVMPARETFSFYLVENHPVVDEEKRGGVRAALIVHLPIRPEATIEYSVPDDRKAGGAYGIVTSRVQHIFVLRKTLVMADGMVIGLEEFSVNPGLQFAN